MGLNTRRPPFSNVLVRRALNYAVDRAKLSRSFRAGLPPYVSAATSVYPRIRNATARTRFTLTLPGVWSAPDLAKAKALIAASGTRGTPITIWSAAGYLTDFTSTGRYLVSLLDRLGYPTQIKPREREWQAVLPGGGLANASSGVSRSAASRSTRPRRSSSAPSSTAAGALCPTPQGNPNATEFCDRRFDASVRDALAAQTAGSPTAATQWAKADRQFTAQAPDVPLEPRAPPTSSHAASATTNTTPSSESSSTSSGCTEVHLIAICIPPESSRALPRGRKSRVIAWRPVLRFASTTPRCLHARS